MKFERSSSNFKRVESAKALLFLFTEKVNKLDKTGMKFVDFEKYCKKCEYNNTAESDVPCWECLEQPVNYHSEKPIHFKERDEK